VIRLPTLRPLLATTLLATSATTWAAPTATFDTTPRPGQHQRQRVEMQMKITTHVEAAPGASDEERARIAERAAQLAQTGPVTMALKMEQTLLVGRPDPAGWLPVQLSATPRGGSFEVGGQVRPIPASDTPKTSLSARFNPRDFSYEIVKFQGNAALSDALRQAANNTMGEALQLFKALAQRPMKVGDSVDLPMKVPLPVPVPGSNGGLDSNLRYTLVRVARGVAYFDLAMDLNISAELPAQPQPAQAASAAPPAAAASSASQAASAEAAGMLRLQASGTAKGTSALRLSDRLPLSSQLAMDMRMNMQGPDNARMSFDMALSMKSEGESLGKARAKKKP
jgi:hypothetical protein